MRHALRLTFLAIVALPCVARGQCRPPGNSHEARLLAFYSVPVVFVADPTTLAIPSKPLVSIGVEGEYVPTPSAELQHTEFCYTGKAEHTSLTKFFGRPRLAVSLPSGVGAELSYLPPVTIAQATPNLFSAALWLTRTLRPGTNLTFRVNGTTGSIRGPITCPKEALQQQDPNAPCYGTAQSTDEFRPRMIGEEILLTRSLASSPFSFVAGIGMNELMPRFRVGFSDLSGGTDHTTIAVNLRRFTGLLGGSFRFTPRCSATAEGYASASDVATVRGLISCTPWK